MTPRQTDTKHAGNVLQVRHTCHITLAGVSLLLEVAQLLPFHAEWHQLRSLTQTVVDLCNALPEPWYVARERAH